MLEYTRITYELRRIRKRLKGAGPDNPDVPGLERRAEQLRRELAATPEAQRYAADAALARREGKYRYETSKYSKPLADEGARLRRVRRGLNGALRDVAAKMQQLRARQAELRRQKDECSLAFIELAARGGPKQ